MGDGSAECGAGALGSDDRARSRSSHQLDRPNFHRVAPVASAPSSIAPRPAGASANFIVANSRHRQQGSFNHRSDTRIGRAGQSCDWCGRGAWRLIDTRVGPSPPVLFHCELANCSTFPAILTDPVIRWRSALRSGCSMRFGDQNGMFRTPAPAKHTLRRE